MAAVRLTQSDRGGSEMLSPSSPTTTPPENAAGSCSSRDCRSVGMQAVNTNRTEQSFYHLAACSQEHALQKYAIAAAITRRLISTAHLDSQAENRVRDAVGNRFPD